MKKRIPQIIILTIIILGIIYLTIPQAFAQQICSPNPVPNIACNLITSQITNCTTFNYTIFYQQAIIEQNNLTLFSNNFYYINFTENSGVYFVSFCDGSSQTVLVQPSTNTNDTMLLSILTLIPIILAFAFLYLSFILSDEHKPLKELFRLLLLPLFLLGLRFGLAGISIAYPLDTEVTGLIADTTWYISTFLYIWGAYILIWIVWKLIQTALRKKQQAQKEKYDGQG